MVEQIPFADVKRANSPEPRCPSVLLVDVSGSMAEIVGESGKDLGHDIQQDGQTYRAVSGGKSQIDMVNEGLRHYQADVTIDRLAAIRVEVSVIAFGNTVETVTPFVTASEFAPPTLVANGETMMGAAILQAIDTVTIRKQQYKQNALHYYRPWIFMITDGTPTDSWQAAAAKVKEGEEKKNRVLCRRRRRRRLRHPLTNLGSATTRAEGVQLQGNVRVAFGVPTEHIPFQSWTRRPSQTDPTDRLGKLVSTASTWSVLGEKAVGTSHNCRGTPCQDAFAHRTLGASGEWLECVRRTRVYEGRLGWWVSSFSGDPRYVRPRSARPRTPPGSTRSAGPWSPG